jgi:hypothetical protein
MLSIDGKVLGQDFFKTVLGEVKEHGVRYLMTCLDDLNTAPETVSGARGRMRDKQVERRI